MTTRAPVILRMEHVESIQDAVTEVSYGNEPAETLIDESAIVEAVRQRMTRIPAGTIVGQPIAVRICKPEVCEVLATRSCLPQMPSIWVSRCTCKLQMRNTEVMECEKLQNSSACRFMHAAGWQGALLSRSSTVQCTYHEGPSLPTAQQRRRNCASRSTVPLFLRLFNLQRSS